MKSGYKKLASILVLFTVLFVVPGLARAGDSDLDPSFGAGGLAQVTVGVTAGGGSKIALQSDGKTVQVGSSTDSYVNYGSDIAVVRYNTDGSLDTSFGADGVIKTNMLLDEVASAVAIQVDGKIVAGGRTRSSTNDNLGWDAALVRYNTDGALDTNFGSSGKVIVNLGSVEAINDIALQSSGRIIAVGTTLSGGNNRFLVMRFNTDGTLDTTFGTSGYVVEHFTENTLEDAYSVAILDDDSLIVAGRGIKADSSTSISMLKLTAGGALDTSFSGDGRLAVTVGTSSQAVSVAVDSAGRFVVGGHRRFSSSSDYEFLLLRYNANGTLDSTFGTGGQVVTPFGAPYTNQQISSLALQDDGKIVVAGNGYIPAIYDGLVKTSTAISA